VRESVSVRGRREQEGIYNREIERESERQEGDEQLIIKRERKKEDDEQLIIKRERKRTIRKARVSCERATRAKEREKEQTTRESE